MKSRQEILGEALRQEEIKELIDGCLNGIYIVCVCFWLFERKKDAKCSLVRGQGEMVCGIKHAHRERRRRSVWSAVVIWTNVSQQLD